MFPRVTHQCATLITWCKHHTNPVQLACVKPAASVRSEPGSNSHIKFNPVCHYYSKEFPLGSLIYSLIYSPQIIPSAYTQVTYSHFTHITATLRAARHCYVVVSTSVSGFIENYSPSVNTKNAFFLFFFHLFYNSLNKFEFFSRIFPAQIYGQ